MSELIVEVVKIKNVEKHPNADRLDLVTVKGWQCVATKDSFKIGDKAIYLPIDSVLSGEIEPKLFPPESKVKLSKSRIKTIKLRGAISQGMVVSLNTLNLSENIKIGTNVKDKLGITKYEPPKRGTLHGGGVGHISKKQINPNFRKYTNINHVKNYPEIFNNVVVVITEKIHGTNFRVGYVKHGHLNLWQKILKLFGRISDYEFVFGSHNVQLQSILKRFKKTFYKKNIYLETVIKYDLQKKLQKNEVIYAEIYGYGIQKNYHYGCKKNEYKMVIVDIMINGEYIDTEKAIQFCEERNLPYVPVLYKGVYNQEIIDKYVKGKSVLSPKHQPIREGIVITSAQEQMTYMGRAILKYINPKYLLKDQSEWH